MSKRSRIENSTEKVRKNKKTKRSLLVIFLVFIVIALILAGIYFAFYQTGKKKMHPEGGISVMLPDQTEDAYDDEGGRLVKYKGSTYRLNENIVSVLCMGVDREELPEDSSVPGENGQADALFLVTLDVKTGKTTVIGLSRDALADVDVYSYGGSFIRTDNKQICLAYAYGDGKNTSAKNVMRSFSRLFYGMPLKYYFAMDLESIAALNDSVGGVTLTSLETLRLSGKIVTKGEVVTLLGKDARDYVQYRDSKLLDSNNQRIKRQRQYLTEFSQKVLKMTKKNISVPVKLFKKVLPYSATNLEVSDVTYLTTRLLETNINGNFDFKIVKGKVVQGKKYAEFIVDETALYELILEVFYNKVD